MKNIQLCITAIILILFSASAMADEDAKRNSRSVKATEYVAPQMKESELQVSAIVSNLTQAYTDKGGKIAVVLSSFDHLYDNELLKEISELNFEEFKEKFPDKKDLLKLGESIGIKVSHVKGREDWVILTTKKDDYLRMPSVINIEAFKKDGISCFELIHLVALENDLSVNVFSFRLPSVMMEKVDFKWGGGTFGELITEICEKVGENSWDLSPFFNVAADGTRIPALGLNDVVMGSLRINFDRN